MLSQRKLWAGQWAGFNVVKTGRVMLGETNIADSKPGTRAEKEIGLWFTEKELTGWTPAAEKRPCKRHGNDCAAWAVALRHIVRSEKAANNVAQMLSQRKLWAGQWAGFNVVKTGRVMLGETNIADSKPGTRAEKEIGLWFTEKELTGWTPAAEKRKFFIQFAKILRKIKSTLQHRKSKSKQKQSQPLHPALTLPTSTPTPTTTAVSEVPAEALDTQKLNELNAMESNLNRVLNQAVRHQLNGQLCKYTNVMKGWQYRWFTVDPQTGTLSYYLCDSALSSGDDVAPSPHVLASAPRGQVQLAGAVVCPSDEDSRTFAIGCATGDTIKLRAADARARQEWVDGLRAVVESHTKAMDISNSSPLPPRELLAASDAMVSARQALYLTEQWLVNASLARAIENIDCPSFSPTDPDLLLLKAISTASTQCLHQCLSLLQRHQEIHNNSVSSQRSNDSAGVC